MPNDQGKLRSAEALTREREELLLVLKGLCREFGLDITWSDDLHTADIVRNIEKQLIAAREKLRLN